MKAYQILLVAFSTVLLLLPKSDATAQQYIGNTQFLWNQMAINPAYAGSKQSLESGVFYRNQWAGFEGAPTTENIFAHAPLSKNGFGAGVNFMRDRIGITRDVAVQANFSYTMKMNSGRLSFGLSGEYGSQRFDWTSTDPFHAGDQAIPFADISANYYNFGFGSYFKNENFFVGFSVPRLLETKQSFRNAETGVQAIFEGRRHMYLTAGGLFKVSSNVNIQPITMVRYVEGAPVQADLGALVNLNKVLWVGSTYRLGDAISLIVDYDINNQLRVGYAFDYTISRLQGHAGTHEFFLGFALEKKRDGYLHPRFF